MSPQSSSRMNTATPWVWVLMLGVATAAPQVSYVIEPFDHMAEIHTTITDHGFDQVSTPNDALFGKDAMKITLRDGAVEVGNITGSLEPAHNCLGATQLSFCYKVMLPTNDNNATSIHANSSNSDNKTSFSAIQAQLALMDDSDCTDVDGDCTNETLLQKYESETITLQRDGEWNEIRWDFPLASWNNTPGNNKTLNMSRLRGWEILVSEQHQAVEPTEIFLDQLACLGGSDLFMAPFFAPGDRIDETTKGVWNLDAIESEYGLQNTKVVFNTTNKKGSLNLDYVVQQSKAWGGSTVIHHNAPSHAYYNLSEASSVLIQYNIKKPSTAPGRAHFRLNLFDMSDCDGDVVACRQYQWNEAYFSFHYVFISDSPGQKNFTIKLEGDSDASSPFWRTGWTGKVGNNVLDREYIKGYVLEISLDNLGEPNSTVAGSIELMPLELLDFQDSVNVIQTSRCTSERGLVLDLDKSKYHRARLGQDCCKLCEEAKDCVLSVVNDYLDCFVVTELMPGSITLASSSNELSAHTFLAPKRGRICSQCRCKRDSSTIDCRGMNLTTVPSDFVDDDGIELHWKPKVLDLRDDPGLVYIGSESISSVASGELELRVPSHLQYISGDVVNAVDALSFDDDRDPIQNIITEPTEPFGNVCCLLNEQGRESLQNESVAQCEMQQDHVGSDTTFLPFMHVAAGSQLLLLRPSSPFMAEAAASRYTCAEYCKFSKECRFFEYDGRKDEAEHSCRLYSNNEPPLVRECCGDRDFADDSRTMPGFVSGQPPRTRKELDNAQAVVSPKQLNMNVGNGYSVTYTVRLGASPRRGAVWITPRVASSPVDVVIEPKKIALYDNETVAVVSATVANIPPQ